MQARCRLSMEQRDQQMPKDPLCNVCVLCLCLCLCLCVSASFVTLLVLYDGISRQVGVVSVLK